MTDTNPSGLPNAEKMAANHIRNLIIKSVCPVLKNIRPLPDNVEDFKNEFGAIGLSFNVDNVSIMNKYLFKHSFRNVNFEIVIFFFKLSFTMWLPAHWAK